MSSVEDHFNLVGIDPFGESEYNVDDIEKKDIQDFIQETINKLPERYAAVITMFYINEMSIEEISHVMEISITNTKVLLHRSRNSLRDLIINSKLVKELI